MAPTVENAFEAFNSGPSVCRGSTCITCSNHIACVNNDVIYQYGIAKVLIAKGLIDKGLTPTVQLFRICYSVIAVIGAPVRVCESVQMIVFGCYLGRGNRCAAVPILCTCGDAEGG